MRTTCFLLLLFVAVNCSDDDDAGPSITYLNSILDLMEQNSVNRKTIDWTKVRANAVDKANGAQTNNDLYPAIMYALIALGDHHSSYSNGTVVLADYPVCIGSSAIVGEYENIGYIKIAGFSGDNQNEFAKNIQDEIKAQDNENIIGWIVDLRGNTGGNMWPMIAGVGPILGSGDAGYFVYPDGTTVPYGYLSGSSKFGDQLVSTVTSPYVLIHQQPKVALLLDQRVASSGEATAIAFIGRPNTRSFGIATCGLSTSNQQYTLSDGATLTLTTALLADRNHDAKGGALIPDVTITGDAQIVAQAVEWLNVPE